MEERKKEHIDLAFLSRVEGAEANRHFYYEPLLSPHPDAKSKPVTFAGKTMQMPLWISSMTGGTASSKDINRNLAQACAEFGLGMGLGSCRILLEDDKHLADFDVRPIMGDDVPLFANIGIAQLEKMAGEASFEKIEQLVSLLRADGLIIHVNPLQEAFQPEGDLLEFSPIETIRQFMEKTKLRVIVKEVGQGMGPESLRVLLALPLEAVEFGALGGTNFTRLELMRQSGFDTRVFEGFATLGHTAEEMTGFVNNIVDESNEIQCRNIIISGGISNILDGYRLVKISKMPALFGMGSEFLKHAATDYPTLRAFVTQIKKSTELADAYLRIRQ